MTLTLSTESAVMAARTGANVRVAIVDSGVAAGHPHVGAVEDGIWLTNDAQFRDFGDRIGHGTAVAGAVRDLAPDVQLIAVRIFDQRLSTSAALLARAVRWASREGNAQLINLSLGTTNARHETILLDAVAEARDAGALVVAAESDGDRPCLPGALHRIPRGEGVIGVVPNAACPRYELHFRDESLGASLIASPFPRPIPGVAVDRNYSGVSFAVANATGMLARFMEGRARVGSAPELLALARADAEQILAR